MILAFADDFTVIAVDDLAQAHTYCEVEDIQEGVWTFLDRHGSVLRPVLPSLPESRIARWFWAPSSFTLVATEERRPDLLQAVFDGRVSVDSGPRIRSREELIKELGAFRLSTP